MAQAQVEALGANTPAGDLNGPGTAGSVNFMDKYNDERDKRLAMRPEGINQFVDLRVSDKYRHFLDDPWIESGTPINTPVPDGGHVKILIIGTGLGGVQFAVKLIRQGISVDDMVFVDPAGGFGGTWYYNRYPGLMCDIESYIYLPLLEEMNYMPKRRYASGHEIREYTESICSKYDLHKRAMFQSTGTSMTWDDSKKEWAVKITKKPKGGQESEHTIYADKVIFATGVLNNAKLPAIPGIDDYQGHMFHTARWDYAYTGGNPADPTLTGLKGKKVGFVGTGATAIQAVPEIARYAEQLYIIQRTPSAVDERGNRNTDAAEWKTKIAAKPGWQRERNLNFMSFLNNVPQKPPVNMVDDGWTTFPSYSALIGGPKQVTMETVKDHVGELHALDYPRSERIRQRASQIVKDQETAKSLQAWYPGWCKRPCFHDEYLQTFNEPNVSLIDTDGKGIDRITPKGIEIAGKEYDVDVIIWGTGFLSPFLGTAAGKGNIKATGLNGKDLEKVDGDGELHTLHGICTHDFPNMFFPGPLHAGIAANQSFVLDIMATHIAYVIAQAERNLKAGDKAVVQPTREAQDAWTMGLMPGAVKMAGMAGCTPGYLNAEGAPMPMTQEEQMKAAKRIPFVNGIAGYIDAIEAWRAKGDMQGIQVTAA